MTTCHFNGVMDVSEFIRYVRKQKSLTHGMLCLLLPISTNVSTIKNYESGCREPFVDRLLDIEAATGISVNLIDPRIKRAVAYIQKGVFAEHVKAYPHSQAYVAGLCGLTKYIIRKLCNIPLDCMPITAEQACMIADFVECVPIPVERVKRAEQQDKLQKFYRAKERERKRAARMKQKAEPAPEPTRRKIENEEDRERFARNVMRSLLGEYNDPYRFDRKFAFRCIGPGRYEAQTERWTYITIDIIDQAARLRVWWRRDGHLVMERMIAA